MRCGSGEEVFVRLAGGCKVSGNAEISVMLATMTVYRHLLVGLLALALTVGTGWQSCATLQQHSPPISAMDQMASHVEGHQHAIVHDHDGTSNDHVVSVAHQNQPAGDAHACLKCCGLCMLTSVIPRGPDWAVAAMASCMVLALPGEQLQGHIVFVDPDIPKQIVT